MLCRNHQVYQAKYWLKLLNNKLKLGVVNLYIYDEMEYTSMDFSREGSKRNMLANEDHMNTILLRIMKNCRFTRMEF